MKLSDAHCHLQDTRFDGRLDLVLAECRNFGISRWMVNATREADWETVAALAARHSTIRCSFGLHPWWQKLRGTDWQAALERTLRQHPEAAIGETGLDRWMEGFDFADQLEVLQVHLSLSKKLDRPISLHCLRAWPELASCLKRCPPSERGFLLHSFNGPAAMVDQWVELGAYFSFSPAFLRPAK
ncbi:MAG: TatD family deoxyribonuclease, partial [Verrucomicrobia bacterium]|nr:TatD family deoxyribonuclease [Verrucomicrobiota bacterium]